MPDQIIELKAALRREMRGRLQGITPEHRLQASQAICERLRQSPAWEAARTILFFAPMLDEPDLWPLKEAALAAGKVVGLPRYGSETKVYAAVQVKDLKADLRLGKFGIREPMATCEVIPWEQVDLVLVPGVAFDLQGRRLGRGRGFYDRLLAQVRGVKCGVAFDEQIVPEVPQGTQDERMGFVATQTRFETM